MRHSVTDRYIRELMAELIDKPLGVNQIWNVNFPGCDLSECGGILRNRSVSTDVFYGDIYNETRISDDRIQYMVEGIRNWEAAQGTDLRAILDNYISIGVVNNFK